MRGYPVLFCLLLVTSLGAGASSHHRIGVRDIRVTFAGQVISGACSLVMEDAWQSVDMGMIPARSLVSGYEGVQRPFTLRLKDCELGGASAQEAGRRMQVIFDGVRGDAPDQFSVTGRATGVGLQILDSQGYIARAGEVMPPQPMPDTTLLRYTLRAVRNGHAPEAGEWSATLRFRLVYE